MKNFISLGKIFYMCAAAIVLLCMFTNAEATSNAVSKDKTSVHFAKNTEGNLTLTIKTTEEKNVEFYLFRASGELVNKLITTSKKTDTIQKPGNGQYLYQCFEKDRQIVSGTLSITNNELKYD